MLEEEEKEKDKKKSSLQYRLNQSGNILYIVQSSTDISEKTKKTFQGINILVNSLIRAISNSNRSIFDYEAWEMVLNKSGYFSKTQKRQDLIQIKKNETPIDMQIINQLFPSFAGNSLHIAKSIVSSMGSEINSNQQNTIAGHCLFICEELFDEPTVLVRLFSATKESHKKILENQICQKTAKNEFELLQQSQTFLFSYSEPETVKIGSSVGDKVNKNDEICSSVVDSSVVVDVVSKNDNYRIFQMYNEGELVNIFDKKLKLWKCVYCPSQTTVSDYFIDIRSLGVQFIIF